MALSRAGWELIFWNRRVRSRPLLAYALSCAIVGVAIGVRLLLGDALIGVPFITIFPAVVTATFLGGLGPGVLAMLLGGAGTWTFLLPQPDPAAAGVDPRLAPLVTYALVAGFDCLLIDWLLKSAERNAALAGRNQLLMRELQHRVKNHVQMVSSLLNVQAARAQAGARQALLDASRRVQALASLYRDNYTPSEQVEARQYLQHLCKGAEEGFAEVNITLSVPSDPVYWSLDKTMLVSLIVNELLTNAFRHGLAEGPGTIAISLRRLNGEFELSVWDTGGRLPAGFDFVENAGVGLSIVDRIAIEIDGHVCLLNREQARFAVIFPV